MRTEKKTDSKFVLPVTLNTEAEIDTQTAIWWLHQKIREMAGLAPDWDDAGLDWLTDDHGNTWIGDTDWLFSNDPKIAALVDAINVIQYGHTIKLSDRQEFYNPQIGEKINAKFGRKEEK